MQKVKNDIKIKVGQKFPLTIKRLGINGEGIGYFKRKITFVPQALPGEVILAEVTKVHPKYLNAKIKKIRKASPDRVEPVDNYDVGGIELEHLAYSKQLEFKTDVIRQSLEKFKPTNYENMELRPTLGMEVPYEYRNKAQFPVRKVKGNKVIAGLYKPNSHILVDLPTFKTQIPLTMEIMRKIVKLLEKWNISIYDERRNSGILKTVVIRQTLKTEQVQIVFVTARNNCANLNQVVNEIMAAYPQIVSVMQNINPSRSSLVWGEETFKLAGTDRLLGQLGDIKFELSARSFFQLNPSQTEVLYTEVKKALDLKEDETLVDAYCGVGTIGLFVSPDAKEVRGMDIIPEAIEDAKKNAELSGRKNIHYEVGKAEDLFAKWTKNNFVPDALVVDPPRTGLDDKMIETILKYRPNKFVYVSCNPSTLARDLVKLVKIYNVEYIQSVDMFPQTARVEAVVKLSKK